MPTPSFRLLIVAFWAGMMGWLFQRELLPRLVLGPPPGYRDVVANVDPDEEDSPPVTWKVLAGSKQIGTATTSIKRRDDGVTVLLGSIELSKLPVLGLFETVEQPLTLSAESRFYIGPTGQLRHFDIQATAQGVDAPLVVRGRVEKKQLHVTLDWEGSHREETLAYEPRGLVMNSFSPVGRMPNLRVGQAWNIPMVNPLTGRVDLVRVKVTGRELISWGSQLAVAAYVVTQTTGITGAEVRTWVRDDGLVLRQEVPLLLSTMTFERVPDEEETHAP